MSAAAGGALAERHRALSEAAKGGGRRTDATTLRRGGGTALGAAEGSAGLRLRCERILNLTNYIFNNPASK